MATDREYQRVPEPPTNPDIPGHHHDNDDDDPGRDKQIDRQIDNNSFEDSVSSEHKTCSPKIQSSFILCCGFLCFGASMAIIGPTVLELGCLTGEDVGNMSWVFFAQTCSALAGAICSGVITDRFNINYNIFLAIVITIHAVALTILPFTRSLGSLLVLTSFHGLFGGFQDTATNLRMIIMHGQDVPPFLQTLFFFYGLGAFLSPIIAGNFLSEECNRGESQLGDFAFSRRSVLSEMVYSRRRRHNGIGMNLWLKQIKDKQAMFATNLSTSAGDVTGTDAPFATPHPQIIKITTTRIHYAYFIIAMIHFVVTIGLWCLFCIERKREQKAQLLSAEANANGDEVGSVSSDRMDDSLSRSDRSEIDPTIKSQVVCISFWIAVMVFICDGLQGSFGSYIYTYAVKINIGISADDAAYLNSLFWGALALGRLLAIFVSLYVSPRVMLLVDVIGCLVSITLMFIFRAHSISLWVGTTTFGLCLSNIFPTSVSMAESYFRLTGTITCFFVVCSGLGEMTIPLVIGKLFDVIGPVSFLIISSILCVTSVGIYLAVIINGRGITQKLLNTTSGSLNTLQDETALNISPKQNGGGQGGGGGEGEDRGIYSPSGTINFEHATASTPVNLDMPRDMPGETEESRDFSRDHDAGVAGEKKEK